MVESKPEMMILMKIGRCDMFIYSFDKDETDKLKLKGLKVINTTDKYTVFKKPDKLNFNLSDFKKIKLSNRIMFAGR